MSGPRREENTLEGLAICKPYFLCYYGVAMSQDNLIKLTNKETGEVYWTRKNRKKLANAPKIELKKFSKKLRKIVTFKETKK